MKKILFASALLFLNALYSQDTFSICAVDTVTGEVGSAGASCIDANSIPGGVVIISDIHPGVGVIHTQSFWDPSNQVYAQGLMNGGSSPQQILDSLVANDATNNPGIRQYGVVDLFNGGARSAAWTGSGCFNYKNHIAGPNYSIQGNILLGQQILDSMEARFLNTPGDLACKLMAALQGARVVGADTRCSTSGNSSLSAFLRIACPSDAPSTYSIDIVVPQGPPGFEPIDSVQALFNNIHNCSTPLQCAIGFHDSGKAGFMVTVQPNPSKAQAEIIIRDPVKQDHSLMIWSSGGQLIMKASVKDGYVLEKGKFKPGIYHYQVIAGSGKAVSGKFIIAE